MMNTQQTNKNNENVKLKTRKIAEMDDEQHILWFNTIRSNINYLHNMTHMCEVISYGENHDHFDKLWKCKIKYVTEIGGEEFEIEGVASTKKLAKVNMIKRLRSNVEKLTFKCNSKIKWVTADLFNHSVQYMNSVMNSFRQDKDKIQIGLGIGYYVESDMTVGMYGFTSSVVVILTNSFGRRERTFDESSKRLLRNAMDGYVAEVCLELNSEKFKDFISKIPMPQSLDSKLEDQIVLDCITGQMMALAGAVGASILKPVVDKTVDAALGITGNVLSGAVGLAGNVVGTILPKTPIRKTEKVHPEKEIISKLYDFVQGEFGLDKAEDYSCGTKIIPTFVDMMASGTGVESTMESMRLDPRRTNTLVENPMPSITHIGEITKMVSILDYFTVRTSMVEKQEVFSWLVNPFTIKNTQLGYWSQFYEYWQGGIVINGKFFKTMFHNFSIMVSYTPFVLDVNYEQARSSTLCSIIDMKNNDEFEIKIPYTAITGMRRTHDEVPMGVFKVWIQNVMTINGTVSDSVECVLTVRGDNDFNYSGIIGQMEETEVLVGESSGVADEKGQTTILMDNPLEVQKLVKENFSNLSEMATSAKSTKVEFTTRRMFNAGQGEVTAVMDRSVGPFYELDLFNAMISDPCLINTTMFARTAMNMPVFKVTVMSNSLRTMAGAMAIGVMYQPGVLHVEGNWYASRLTLQDAIKRGAQIVDFSIGNEVEFDLSYFNRMPMLSQMDERSNVGDYLKLYAWILSPLRTGEDSTARFTFKVMLDMGDTKFSAIVPEINCSGFNVGMIKNNIHGQGDIDTEILGSVNGISCNINEDHESIGDILKRYSFSQTFNVNGAVSIPIRAGYTQNGIQGAILKCFKNSRMSFNLLVHVKVPGESLMSNAVNITPLVPNNVSAINSITSVPGVSSFTHVSPGVVPSTPVPTPLSAVSRLQPEGGNAFDRYWISQYISGFPKQFIYHGYQDTSESMRISNDTFNERWNIENNNSTIVNNVAGVFRDRVETIRNVTTATSDNVSSIKSAMDSNLSLNLYNNQVGASIGSSVNGINSLASNSNVNVGIQDSNNNLLAAAVSGGADVIVSGGVIVKLAWQPYTGRGTPSFGSGIGSTMINTSINSTKVIHVPRYTLFNYEEVNGVDSNLPTTFDKACQYVGELLAYSDVPVVIDLYVRPSDDAQLVYYLGTETIEGQMDFPSTSSGHSDEKLPKGEKKGMLNKIKSSCTPKTIKNVNKLVMSGDKLTESGEQVLDKSSKLIDKVGDLCTDVKESFEDFGGKVSGLVETVKSQILQISNKLKNLIPEGMDFSVEAIVSAVLQLLMAIMNPTPSQIIMTTLSILLTVKVINMESFKKIYDFLMKKIGKNPDSIENREDQERIEGQCEHGCKVCKLEDCIIGCGHCEARKKDETPLLDEDGKAMLASLIAGGFSAMLGYKATSDKKMTVRLFNMSSSFWRTQSGSRKFFVDIISLVKKIAAKFMLSDKSLKVDRNLSNVKMLVDFNAEITSIMSKMNEQTSFRSMDGQRRVTEAYLRALDYRAMLVGNVSKSFPNLLKNIDRFIALVELNMDILTNSLSRPEPFVIKYYGNTRVGKSHQSLLDCASIVTDYMKIIPQGEMVFSMPTGVEFLNNYKHQPVIHFDEIFATKDEPSVVKTANFIMTLKSSASLNANMANLDDKNLCITSPLVVMCTNEAFFKPNVLASGEAFLQRCDLLVGQRLKLAERMKDKKSIHYRITDEINDFVNGFTKKLDNRVRMDDFTKEEKSNPDSVYEYIVFKDPSESKSYEKNEDGTPKWMSHTEFMKVYGDKASDFHMDARRKMLDRLKIQTGHIKTSLDLDVDTMDRVFDRAQAAVQPGGLTTEYINMSKSDFVRINKESIDMIIEVLDKKEAFVDLEGQSSEVEEFRKSLLTDEEEYLAEGECVICVQETTIEGNQVVLKWMCGTNKKSSLRRRGLQCPYGICIACANKYSESDMLNAMSASKCGCNASLVSSAISLTNGAYVMKKLRKCWDKVKAGTKNILDEIPHFDLGFIAKCVSIVASLFSMFYTVKEYKAYRDSLSIKVQGQSAEVEVDEMKPQVVVDYVLYDMKNLKLDKCVHEVMKDKRVWDNYVVSYHEQEWTFTYMGGAIEWKAGTYCNQECAFLENRVVLLEKWKESNPKFAETYELATSRKETCDIPKEYLKALKNKGGEIKPTNFIEKLKKKFPKALSILCWVGGIGGALLSIIGIYKLCDWMKPKKITGQYGHSKSIKAKPKVTKEVLKSIDKTLSGQGEETQTDVIIKKLRTNFVVLKSDVDDEEGDFRVRVLGIKQNYAIITEHEAKMLLVRKSRGANLTYSYCVNDNKEFKWENGNDLKFRSIERSKALGWNLVLITFPRGRHFVDVSKYVWKSAQIPYFSTRVKAMRVSTREYGRVDFEDVEIFKFIDTDLKSTNAVIDHEEKLTNVFCSNYTGKGHCGSILIDSRTQTPVVGFHVAGNERYGFQVPLVREFVTGVCDQLEISGQSNEWKEDEPEIVATVEKDLVPFYSTKTSIRNSIYRDDLLERGFIEYTAPAVLHHKDPRWVETGIKETPLMVGAEKHMKNPVKPFDQVLVNIAANDVLRMIIENAKPTIQTTKPIDLQTAICGLTVGGSRIVEPMKLSASAGWPHNLGNRKSKSDYISVERDEKGNVSEFVFDEEMKKQYDYQLEIRATGKPYPTIFQDAIKDERRNKSKVQPRIYSMGEMLQLITFKQAYGAFMDAFTKNFADCEHAVGINVNGPEWTELVNRLQSKGEAIFDGDFKDFGPRLPSQMVEAAFEIVMKWYEHYSDTSDPEFKKWQNIRRSLKGEIVRALHIVLDIIYRAIGGIPSGHPGTTPFNSLALLILLRVVYLVLTAGTSFSNMIEYNKHVYSAVCGDDHLVNVSDLLKEIFNCETVSKLFAGHGFVYTDASKAGNVKYKTIKEVTFLKNSVKEHPYRKGHYLAALDWNVVQETALWIRKGMDEREASDLNCEQSLRLAYGHGPDKFMELKDVLNKVLRLRGGKLLSLDWFELDRDIFENGYRLVDDIMRYWE